MNFRTFDLDNEGQLALMTWLTADGYGPLVILQWCGDVNNKIWNMSVDDRMHHDHDAQLESDAVQNWQPV